MNIIGISGRRSDGSSAGAGKDEVAKCLAKNHGFVVVSLADPIKRTAMEWYSFSVEQIWGSKKEEPDLRYPREHGPWERSNKHIDDYRDTWLCACCGIVAVTSAWDGGIMHYAPRGTPPCYLTPRSVMRFLGTEAGRMFFADTWVEIAMRTAKTLLHSLCDYTPEHGLIEWAGGLHKGVVIPDVRWPAGNEGKAIHAAGGRLWLVERQGTSQTGAAAAKHRSETQPIPDEVFDVIIKNDGTLADLEQKVDVAMKNQGKEAK